MPTQSAVTQEPRSKQLAAAVSEAEKKAAELAVEVDKLGSVSEALRVMTVDQLIGRGRELMARLREIGEGS